MSKKAEITGVILAGGKGTRMHPFSDNYPKPILPILNQPLLTYQISYMKKMGISEIFIVIGNLGYEIVQTLGDGEKFGVRLHYVEQQETLGLAHAIGALEPYLQTPFLLFLGDIFFVTVNLQDIVDIFYREPFHAVLAVKEENDPELVKRNFAVILNEDGTVKRVIEKPRSVNSTLKGCGLYLFDLSIFDAIRRTPRTAMRDEYEITDSIQILINDGYRVGTASIIEEDVNLTYPRDLWECNLRQLKKVDQKNMIGSNTSIHSESVIENSVVGNDVLIPEPVRLSNAVVFDHTEVHRDVVNGIITPYTFVADF